MMWSARDTGEGMAGRVELLVSVAGAAEVALAVAGGADVVDLKAPADGSLGAPDPCTLRAVAAALGSAAAPRAGRPRLSVALGDAFLPPAGPGPGTYALAAWAAGAAGAAYVKVGLRGAMTEAAAVALVAAVAGGARAAAPGVRVIAGGFADAAAIGALAPARLPGVAAAAGADGILLDTALKDGRRLLDRLDLAALRAIVAEARRLGLLVALAGSLRAADLRAVAALGPDLVGVRGAACAGGRREGPIDEARVSALRRALDAASAARA